MCVVGRRIESKPVSLAKNNDLKQNYSSSASLQYKPRGLVVTNNRVYRTMKKNIFAVFLRYKMSQVQ